MPGMSHRPAPRPLRAALALLLTGSLALSACGRDEADQSAGAKPGTTAATTPPTTPVATTPPATPEDDVPDRADAAEKPRGGESEAPSGDASVPEAEPKPGSPEDKARDALKAAGFKVSTYLATGNARSSIAVGEDAVVAFYRSPAAAEEEAAAFETAFNSGAPVYGIVETKGTVLYMVTQSQELSAEDKSRFRKMVSAVEATR